MHSRLLPLLLSALLVTAPVVRATIVYSGIQNVDIPLDFNGVFLRIDTGISTLVEPGNFNTAPWMNPFFGGVDLGNGNLLRPVITGASQIVNLAPGTLIGSASNFVAGQSGSSTHVGPAANQFQVNVPGYLGATFRQTPGGPDYYGWVQMDVNNAGVGKIIAWAFEGVAGAPIAAGQTSGTSPVPEPGTALFGFAMILAGLGRRSRDRR
jgi:hypothetical protein